MPKADCHYFLWKGNQMADLTHVNEESFPQVVLKSNLPVVVEFGAEWCRPCKALLPALTQMAAEWKGKAVFVQLDVDECPNITSQYGVMSLPTLLLFKNGQPVQNLGGYQPREKLVEKIQPHL
jgi:thioredoxin 1